MAISFPLVAKGLAGLAAIGTPVAAGVYYKNEIADILFSKSHAEEINKTLKDLKIENDGCKFSDSDNSKECDLTKSDLDKLEFASSNSSSESDVGNDSIRLKIEKVTEEEKSIFGDLKFSFPDITKTIKIGKSGNQTTLKKGSKPEFKQKGNKLERAWTLGELAKKVGLKCPKDNENSDKCSLESGKKINIKENSNKSEDVTFTGDISFVKDQEDHNQGFKFTVSADIDLTKSESTGSLTPSKLTKDNSSYEIVKDGDKWYLSKITSTSA